MLQVLCCIGKKREGSDTERRDEKYLSGLTDINNSVLKQPWQSKIVINLDKFISAVVGIRGNKEFTTKPQHLCDLSSKIYIHPPFP